MKMRKIIVLAIAATLLLCTSDSHAAVTGLLDIEQIVKLNAIDAAEGDRLGWSVAISGNTAIAGACRDDDAGTSSGSAYLLDITTGNTAKLTADDAAGLDFFGYSVAVSNNTAIVGAWGGENGGINTGSAYLFNATTGTQSAKLTASDAAVDDKFGWSVAISENTAIVGAYCDDDGGPKSGSAYLFNATTGSEIAKLTADDAAGYDYFGHSVAISGNTAIVGAYSDDDGGTSAGSAYLFNAITGEQVFKLTANDAAAYDNFGFSVAIDGNIAIVGAWSDDSDVGIDSGSAYLFDVTTGEQLAKLVAEDAAPMDFSGYSVSIFGDLALVGAFGNDDDGPNSGAAYLFDVTTGEQLAKLTADDAGGGDFFGHSVAVGETFVMAGAYGDDEDGSKSGSAYLYGPPAPEPGTLALLAIGSGIVMLRRKLR